MHFPPFFRPLLTKFFHQQDIWSYICTPTPGWGGGWQTIIYNPEMYKLFFLGSSRTDAGFQDQGAARKITQFPLFRDVKCYTLCMIFI